MQVLTKAEQSEDELPEGQDWQVTIEGEAEESDSKTVDPRLAKLKTSLMIRRKTMNSRT